MRGWPLSVVLCLMGACAPAQAAVTDGAARLEVITPSLVRLQYAPGGRFEERPTLTTGTRPREGGRYTTRTTKRGERVIRITLRWR